MKRILWATATVGLSSIMVVALGAVRYKFIALEVGAPGVGLLGILTSAANFGVILFSLGMNTSGVQATAAAAADGAKFPRVKSALLIASSWFGGFGGLVFVLLGLTLGGVLLPAYADPATMVALGAALTAMVISGAQIALLNGLGRVKSLAVCNTFGALVGTVVTIGALQISGQAGVIAALAAAPIATLACSSWFVFRQPKTTFRPTRSQWWPELRGLVTLGGVVMFGLLLTSGTQLAIRVWLEQDQGVTAAGHFQAAWTITTMYLGFVLTSLAVEYYPRISAQIDDLRSLNKSVDDQVRIALLLGGPVLLWMIVFSPVVLHILYAEDFQAATEILRWQLFGDIFKIVGWAVAFLLLARKARGAFFIGEFSFNVGYLALGIPIASQGGLTGLGVAYVGAYAFYVCVVLILAYRETGFALRRASWILTLALLVAGAVTMWGMDADTTVGLIVGIAVTAIVSAGALATLFRLRAKERQAEKKESLLV
ncbi:oligosaccharide flippase family protein [Cryobacterium sp. Y11]|uniref:oligosaccharide flippase family protein n=1 Tax=Cryobacterium sp. Y11 TaxID=2045016 RepID=UPI0011B04003|nr:oligosaccharide flippase family protein [Cryobacterium sp. Y11]